MSHYLLVKFLEAELCDQSVCKFVFSYIWSICFLGSPHFYFWSVIVIQIIGFFESELEMFWEIRCTSRESWTVIWGNKQTQNSGIWVSSEELVFLSSNWAKNLKPVKAFLKTFYDWAWINICWIELSLWNRRSLLWLLVDT